ncbi:MAG: PKD domain-containing protein [Ignavibacteriae bacterium]|nr:PKD domain-containing protein [Ignavibacteriota bacterium]
MKQLVVVTLAFVMGCVQPQPTEQNMAPSVQNPVITSVTATPSIVQVGQNCRVTCNAYDPGGDSLSYKWRVDLGDIVGRGATVYYSAAYCCAGTNRITVTVSNTGGSATGYVDVEVR